MLNTASPQTETPIVDSEARAARMAELYAEGWSFGDIAREHGMSRQAIRQFMGRWVAADRWDDLEARREAHREAFLAEVEAYIEATGFAASRFGRELFGDSMFVTMLRKGTRTTPGKIAEVRAFMQHNPP